MPTVAEKLQLKPGTAVVLAGDGPGQDLLAAVLAEQVVTWEVGPGTQVYLGAAVTLAELAEHCRRVAQIEVLDPLVWIAYPKKSSKRYKAEFDRDSGWEGFGALGYEPVRQVAVDEDWSALRFRRVERIEKMTRSFAMTDLGRQKSGR